MKVRREDSGRKISVTINSKETAEGVLHIGASDGYCYILTRSNICWPTADHPDIPKHLQENFPYAWGLGIEDDIDPSVRFLDVDQDGRWFPVKDYSALETGMRARIHSDLFSLREGEIVDGGTIEVKIQGEWGFKSLVEDSFLEPLWEGQEVEIFVYEGSEIPACCRVKATEEQQAILDTLTSANSLTLDGASLDYSKIDFNCGHSPLYASFDEPRSWADIIQ